MPLLFPSSGGQSGNPYIDAPASPNAFDDEFLYGSNPDLSLRPNAYTVRNSSGTTLTRSGNVNPWDSTGPVGNTYWSTIYGSWIFLQAAPGVQIDISAGITLAAGDTFSIRTGGSYNLATGTNGRYNEVGLYALSGSALDGNNRVFMTLRDDTTASQYVIYDIYRFTGGTIGGPGASRIPLGNYDIRAVHFGSGTTHHAILVSSAGGQVVSTEITGAPSSASLTRFGARNLFSTSGTVVPQIWAIDYIRRKTGGAWIVS